MEPGEVDPGPPDPSRRALRPASRARVPRCPVRQPASRRIHPRPASGDFTREVAPADGLIGRRRFIRAVLGFSFLSIAAMVVTPIVGFLIPREDRGHRGRGARVLAGTTTRHPVGHRQGGRDGQQPGHRDQRRAAA